MLLVNAYVIVGGLLALHDFFEQRRLGVDRLAASVARLGEAVEPYHG